MVAVAGPLTALAEGDFRLTGPSGFGDGWNHYAQAMAWFDGRLYVGCTRAQIAFMKRTLPPPDLRPWPVFVPEDMDRDIDRRAPIWQYTPETGVWKCVYLSPMVKGFDGREIAAYVGYRGAAVFQGATDTRPCLYFATWSPRMAGPAELLRSEDGENFAVVPRPPWDDSVRAFRIVQGFDGRLHTSPTASGQGVGKVQDSVGSDPTIFAAADVRGGAWAPANASGFGNPHNLTVFEMEVFEGWLYASTVNAKGGFELWKTRGGALPYSWTRVLERGAFRGPFNEVGASMAVFNGALYIGTGILNGGYHRAFRLGPAASELLRVWPDDSWDLIVGDSRVTPQGVKYPLSGFAAGFDNLFNGYVWRMCVHRGYLYAGTFCWANLFPYLPAQALPEDLIALLRRWGIEELVRRYGGFDLWRTDNGVHWFPVTRSGFGNPYNWGVRTLASTPHGLFVGTANPYGPTLAVQRDKRWQYIDNPRGGCEVWLGSAHAGSDASAGPA